MIGAFGVRDDRYTTGPYAGIARPAIFVVGADGKLIYSQPVNHYADSPVDSVYAALQGS
jgi:peroxiredoxin